MAFTADANDTATLTATMLVGFFYEFGSVGNCPSSVYQVQLCGIYHLDKLTHCASLGIQKLLPAYTSDLPVMPGRRWEIR